ncbi:MAG: DNA polymerase III subunit beta [Deltaproteobacteria bacterium RIFOXYD12_FULL_50_9]|nr:MAG: DNA polymerase III subunit beta [Deltaproteobacteria bacterium RIFOXYD12_FULL_50_9]
MSLTVNIAKDDFLEGLAQVQNVTGKKGTMAILSNVLLQTADNELVMTATDLEVGIRYKIQAEILSPGTITLPARKIFELVRVADADFIKLEEKENNWVGFKASKTNCNLAGMEADEFPAFPEYNQENMFDINSEVMKDLIEKTIFSVAHEGDSQFNLTGVLIEKEVREERSYLRMISSDGHRLTVMEREIGSESNAITIDKNTIIPKKGLQEIKKFCDLNDKFSIGFEKNQTVIKTDKSLLIIRLMNKDFPDYRNILTVINKEQFFLIDKNNFLNAMKIMNIFSENQVNAVKFEIFDNVITVTSENSDIGSAKEEIEIKYEGESLSLGFNCNFFIETLQVMNGDLIKVYISTEDNPCLIESTEDDGFVSIIMPMKL